MSFHLGGTYKLYPSDFIVEEIFKRHHICRINYSLFGRFKDRVIRTHQSRKDYLHFTLVKRDWDTIRALRYIGKRIHVSLKRFGISGMKDKQAITAQRVSLWKGTIERLIDLRLHDIFLYDFRYEDERINLGTARGNRFTIILRNIPRTKGETVSILHQFKQEVTRQGVPNFYGPQRLESENADVGRAIMNGDLKLGVELILTKVQPYLDEGGIDNIPRALWYEKKMVRHLRKYPTDYAGALRKIPKKIRRFYTHAYQSQIFNNLLKQAIREDCVPETLMVEGFKVAKMPELSTIPINRRSYMVAKDFNILRIHASTATIRFALNKGEYASTLISHLLE